MTLGFIEKISIRIAWRESCAASNPKMGRRALQRPVGGIKLW